MNLILVEERDFVAPARVRLGPRRSAHVRKVLLAGIGDRLLVGLLEGGIGEGRVVDAGERVELEVTFDRPPPPALPLTLVLALPRPIVLQRLVRHLTACGVKRLVLLHTRRVEKSYWHSPKLSPGSLREQMILGLEQARDTRLPRLELRRRFRPFVEDELPVLAAGSLALVAHPGAAEPCPRAVATPVTLAIGPEGGFLPWEIDGLLAAGLHPVEVGDRILPVELVVPWLLGRLF